MPKPTNVRKVRFRKALALAEMMARDFARANNVTEGHLSHVLSGTHPSKKLTDKIDAFTERVLKGTAAA